MNTLAKNDSGNPGSKIWILVFLFCFLGLLIDGADLMLLSYSLSSLNRALNFPLTPPATEL